MDTRTVALLRGINVGGHRRIPMAELRAVAEGLGYTRAVTYIQSGNLVCNAPDGGAGLASAIEKRFGFAVDVALRSAAEWRALVAGCPFPDAAETRPKLLHAAIGILPYSPALAEAVQARGCPEPTAVTHGALWIDYLGGVGRSKLTPALLDRLAGTPMTARNWLTVQAVLELL